eukprot:TRINITY_DN110_c0_g3_i2.p7 TRINITY_DN110_c0_g3~~TRINITY_DN110_c0_g3_i2.p7  ORF type:complete len:119 (-),score=28.28 TRINITY_DN110_c0_g3_i2:1176-1532(-)
MLFSVIVSLLALNLSQTVLATSRLTKAGSIQSSSITDEESSKFLAGDTEKESGTYMHALSLRGLKQVLYEAPPTPFGPPAPLQFGEEQEEYENEYENENEYEGDDDLPISTPPPAPLI